MKGYEERQKLIGRIADSFHKGVYHGGEGVAGHKREGCKP